MKGILQMYDVEAGIGYDRAEQEAFNRSRSRGRDLSAGARSERNEARSPLKPATALGNPESQPNLLRNSLVPNARFNDSF